MRVKSKNALFGHYPSCDLLNNAIRFLLEGKSEQALYDIIQAIYKADGYFYKDLEDKVQEFMENYAIKYY